MSNSVYRRHNCRGCGSHDLELVLKLAPTPVGDAYIPESRLNQVEETYPVELFLCRNCGLAQLIDIIDPEILYRDFIYVTSISLGLIEHFKKYAEDVINRLKLPQSSLIIDIGSNDGTLLRPFQEQGMRVLGIEPALEIARKATESGIETLPTFFDTKLSHQLKEKYGQATVITANNTFANIDDLVDFTNGVKELLGSDGVFIVETGYLIDLVRNYVFDNIYHEHLSYFSVSSLEIFFRSQGMEVIDVQNIDTKGGSIRCFVQLASGTRSVSKSVREVINFELGLKADHPEFFQALNDKIKTVKTQLIDLLKDLKSQGKTIAGYGASVGVTTLTYLFEIGNFFDFIVDDNPAKHSLFSPGYHTPVLPSQEIYDRQPDYVVILAWRYADPIMSKHQTYLQKGGHFILLWPTIEIK